MLPVLIVGAAASGTKDFKRLMKMIRQLDRDQ